jgi:hypothetical protein
LFQLWINFGGIWQYSAVIGTIGHFNIGLKIEIMRYAIKVGEICLEKRPIAVAGAVAKTLIQL